MKTKVSCISTIICLVTLVFFCILACDNGSVSSSVSETDGLVKVSLSVDGESSGPQKSISIEGNNYTYFYKAVPQWRQDKPIHGSTGGQYILIPHYSPSSQATLGYFAPGKWVFYIRILSGSTPIYEGHSAVITISKSSANVTVAVAKIIKKATEGTVSISITAPTINQNTDALTVAWSGEETSGSATATATARRR